MKKISITGTKGKTTISRLLNYFYIKQKRPTLLVDTDGYYLNGKIKGTMRDSLDLWGLVPTVCPGRFLYELKDKKNSVAILETAVGSSAAPGIGYSEHEIGVFTNVFEDHIGRRIKTKNQLADEKASYVFARIIDGGVAVFNADDRLITSKLKHIPEHKKVFLLPVGIDFKNFDIKKHLAAGGMGITMRDDYIGLLEKNKFRKFINIKDIAWTFGGLYLPSVYNLMFAIAVMVAEKKLKGLNRDEIKLIKNYRTEETGGRLTLFTNKKKNISVIADYAHEKFSLRDIGLLANKMAQGKSIGVIRLAPDRDDKTLRETGKFIANYFDVIVVYDKIDGVRRKKFENKKIDLIRKPGEVADIVYQAIKKAQVGDRKVFKQVIENRAVELALSMAEAGDVVVHIVNNDHKKSIEYIKKYLFK